ncbi:MAG: TIR domain-containing protein [Candidatus Brocadiia bacterium]
MKVFICWSGKLGGEVAKVTKAFIENVIQSCTVFVSEDLEKGATWPLVLTEELAQAGFGIVVITRESANAPWLLFEAGCLTKFGKTRVCPLLVDIEQREFRMPLSLFQGSRLDREDMEKLLQSINNGPEKPLLTETRLKSSFEAFWQKYEARVTELLKSQKGDTSKEEAPRIEEIAGETLLIARTIAREVADLKIAIFGDEEEAGKTS